MANFTDVGEQFTDFYYNTFDKNRPNLAALYRENSMLTYENAAILGGANIVQKLVSLPFGNIEHRVETRDSQPSNESGGVLVQVTGFLAVEGEARPWCFSQTFQLLPDAGSYYVFNDIFRLTYPPPENP